MSIELIVSIVTSVVGLIGGGIGILFWRENKRLKQEEAKQSSVTTQSQEIDLGKKFLEEIMAEGNGKMTVKFLDGSEVRVQV